MKWFDYFRLSERNIASQSKKGKHRARYYSSQTAWDFADLTQSGCHNFQPVFTSPRLTFFSCFYLTFTLNSFFFCLSFFQPIRACLPLTSDTFLFLIWASAAIIAWISGTYSSLIYLFLPYHRASLCLLLSLSVSLCLSLPSSLSLLLPASNLFLIYVPPFPLVI